MKPQPLLEVLDEVENALRTHLYRYDLDPMARAHLERAISHTREAYIATNEIGKARTVQRLISDLERADRLLLKLRGQRPGALSPHLHL